MNVKSRKKSANHACAPQDLPSKKNAPENSVEPKRGAAQESSSSRTFRLTCPPEHRAGTLALLQDEGFVFEQEAFCDLAFCLRHSPFPLGSSLAAFFGLIYIQDRSSMLPPLALLPPKAPESGFAVLDMCASPGSKTGLLAQLSGKNGFVLGNEPNTARLATLRANLFTLNCLSTGTCRFAAEELPLPHNLWPYILLDPPCSGWGTIDRNPNIMQLWSSEKTKPLVILQRKLLTRAAMLLQTGGHLLFSTCTTNVAENEEQVLWAKDFLGLEQIPIAPVPGFTAMPLERDGCEGALRLSPDLGQGQGFFLAKFKKISSPAAYPFNDLKPVAPPAFKQRLKNIAAKDASRINPTLGQELAFGSFACPWLDQARLPSGKLVNINNNVIFVPKAASLLPSDFAWQGYLLGKMIGNEIMPLPRLRSLMPEVDECPVDLNLEDTATIRQLLAGNSLRTSLPSGWAGLYYKNVPLALLRIRNGRALWVER